MSFGYSIGDAVSLGQLAWKTLQNARKACGEHDELTREVSSLHIVIRRLKRENSRPESPINRPGDTCKEELQSIVDGCKNVLRKLNRVLDKYNTLSEEERSLKRLWQRIRFGSGELADMRDMREKVKYHTSALSLFVNMVSMGSIGRVEHQMETAGGDIRELRIAINGITAHLLSASNHEGSVLTTYGDDDKAVWKEFRKELIQDGFSSSIIKVHKGLIKAYIKELGDRGLLDDEDPHAFEDLSGSAVANTDNNTNFVSKSQSFPVETALDSSKIESDNPANDQLSAANKTKRSIFFGTNSSPDKMPEAKMKSDAPTNDQSDAAYKTKRSILKDVFGTNSSPYKMLGAKSQVPFKMDTPKFSLYKFQFELGSCLTMQLPVYKSVGSIRKERLDELSANCLTVRKTVPSLISAHFRDRLQILLECLLHTWIFRARKDISEVHILHIPSVSAWIVTRLRELTSSALKILCARRASARILFNNLYVFFAQGFCSQREPWTRFAEFISSRWWHFTKVEDVLLIGEWIRRFDIDFGTIAKRLSDIWVKAVDSLTNSNSGELVSLALAFEKDKFLSVPPVEGASPSEEGNALPTDDNLLKIIWQNNYISTLLPLCEHFILDPPSDTKSRDLEYKGLSEQILTQVLLRLDAVDLKGNQALRGQRKFFVNQAEEMLSKLDEVNTSLVF